jgi:outer membrane cobalamin receptor
LLTKITRIDYNYFLKFEFVLKIPPVKTGKLFTLKESVMNPGKLIVCAVLVLSLSGLAPLAAEEAPGSQVFDLGQVLVVDKDNDTPNKITRTEVVTAEDIRLQGAQNAAEAIDFIPGIDVQSGSKGEYSLKLRGFEQRDVKILIDGVPSRVSYDGSLDLSQIPVDTISQIKVIKGASSVLYGPNTMGGVINIITQKGGDTPYTKLTASFGENATRNYVMNHGGSKGKFNYWVTGSLKESDGFELSDRFDPNNPTTGTSSEYNEDGDTRDLSYYDNMSFNTKLGYEFDADSKIYFSINYIDNERGCPTEGGGRNNEPRYWAFDEWKQWHANLVGEHGFTDIFTVKARVYYQDYTNTIKDASWDADHTTHPSAYWFDKSVYDDFSVGGELQGYLDFGDASLVRMGISYIKDNHVGQDYTEGSGWDPAEESEADTYSFGIEDEMKFFEKLTVTAGVSYDVNDPVKAYDNSDRDKTEVWNPQAGVAYELSNTFGIYGSVGKKTRFPTLSELYSNLAGGNNALEAQETIAYEIGGKTNIGTMTTLSLAAFINDVENRIVRNSSKEYENIGESDLRGVEAQVRFMTRWNLDLGLAYTYMEGEDKESASAQETEAEYLPEHKITADARYFFDFGLTATLQTTYTGDQIEYDSNDEIRDIDNFILVNAKLNQNFALTEKLSCDLFLEMKNIFDENYEEGHGPTPGRSFLAGVSMTF